MPLDQLSLGEQVQTSLLWGMWRLLKWPRKVVWDQLKHIAGFDLLQGVVFVCRDVLQVRCVCVCVCVLLSLKKKKKKKKKSVTSAQIFFIILIIGDVRRCVGESMG